MAEIITDSSITKTLNTDKLVVIKFGANWCPPCKMLDPIIDEISKELEGSVIFCKLDCDENPETTTKYGVKSLPTVLFFKNGEVIDKHVGFVSKGNLTKMIDKNIISREKI
jgi:thioredoxin 1